jgi:intracellular sulfur oxidation DsrE/DsrF family protein
MFKKIAMAMAMIIGLAMPALAEGVNHRVVFHVDQNDPKLMNLTLNNVQNVTKYYESIGDTVEIQIVAYGPGLNMYRADTSPVQDRISTIALQIPTVTFAACGNTLHKMEAKSGKPVELVSEAEVVPSGVVQLISLQEQGWAYVRP